MARLKGKALAGAAGGFTALVGMFLPYARENSFFESLSNSDQGFLAPWLSLGICLAAILYALGFTWVPFTVSVVLFVTCVVFPGYACWLIGPDVVLAQLQAGAWVLFAGLLFMILSPMLFGGDRKRAGLDFLGAS